MDDINLRHGISADGKWLTDKWAPHILWTIGLEETLFDKQSAFQRVQVVKTRGLGRMLILDGNLQAAEADEHGYHELITHPALCRKGAGAGGKRVLIIGGGDGGAAREALRHADVEKVDLCDIDGMVLDAAREMLPTMWCTPEGGSLDDDPRFEAHVLDGVKFLQETEQRWDLIVVDASDPIGPGTVLYSNEFYSALERCLTDTGAVTVQAGSWFYLPEVLQTVRKGLASVFGRVAAYQCFTAIYPGGFWNLCMATRGDDPLDVDEARAGAIEGTRFYDAAAHRAAFALGPRAAEILAEDPPPLDEVSRTVVTLMG
jgi:spermidine synthase